jgi:hypothetical protein
MKLNVLPARTGAQWVRLGFRTFFKQPLALGALFILFLAALSLVGLVPIVGDIVMLVLVPALTAGLMAAAREADGGKTPLPVILFIAFRQGAARTRSMLALGLLYAAAVMVVIGISALIDGGRFLSLVAGSADIGTPEQLSALAGNPRFSVAMWVTLLLYTPVSLAFWHAPALVYWHGVPPVKSLFFSCVAVLKNTRSFLVYGLLWFGLSLAASAVLAGLALLAGNGAILALGALPISLFLGAAFFTSLWFTFYDSFATDLPPGNALPAGTPERS